MTFDEAFERLIGHEGGYVNHPASHLQYVDGHETQSHSRIRVGDACGAGVGNANAHAASGSGLCSADKFAQIRMSCAWLRKAGLCQGVVQRALHPRQKGPPVGCARAGKKAGWRVRQVWRSNWPKGWMGFVPPPLSAGSLRDVEGCCDSGVWREMRTLPRILSSGGLRLPSPWRQSWIAKRDVLEQVTQCARCGVVKVHSPVRQLPPTGAQQ